MPGPHLTPAGLGQADVLAEALKGTGIDGIFASTMIRAQETADPLAAALGMNVPVPEFPGLNEIDAGIFEGIPVNFGGIPLGGALYLLAPALWTLGLYFVPELGSSDLNGMEFQDQFGGAIQTIYDASVASGDSQITDAVFAHEGSIAIWTLMNVNNPDFPLVLTTLLNTGEVLPYTGIVEVQGNPEDGWTLVSWDGTLVPQDPGLPTELFVDVRDLITAPQMAAYHIGEALVTGDPTAIVNAIQVGVGEVGSATVNFPIAVITDVVNALRDSIPSVLTSVGTELNFDTLLSAFSLGDLSTDLSNLLPTIATESAGLLPGDLGTMVGEVLASL